MRLTVRPKTVALVLLAMAVALAISGIVVHLIFLSSAPSKLLKHLDRLFNLDGEANLPALFSAELLFLAAALLGLIAFAKRQHRYFWHWFGLSMIFFFLAIDESVALHESIINAMREVFRASGYFYFAWVIPYGIFTFLVFLAYLPFVRDLPARIRRLFVAAAFCYVGAAMGLEMIAGNYVGQPDRWRLGYTALVATEEFFEMCGIIILIYALLCYAGAEVGNLEIAVSEDTKHPRTTP